MKLSLNGHDPTWSTFLNYSNMLLVNVNEKCSLPSTVNFPVVLSSPILAVYSAPSSSSDLSITNVCSGPSSRSWMRLLGLVIFLPFLNHWTFSGFEVTHLKVALSPSGMVISYRGVVNVTGTAGNLQGYTHTDYNGNTRGKEGCAYKGVEQNAGSALTVYIYWKRGTHNRKTAISTGQNITWVPY